MRRFVSDRGTAAAGLLFMAAVVIVAASVAGLVFTGIKAALTNTTVARLEQAIQLRLADPSASGEVCHAELSVCTDVTFDGLFTVVSAVDESSELMVERRFALETGFTHIAGFDANGEPVWVREPGFTPFPVVPEP